MQAWSFSFLQEASFFFFFFASSLEKQHAFLFYGLVDSFFRPLFIYWTVLRCLALFITLSFPFCVSWKQHVPSLWGPQKSGIPISWQILQCGFVLAWSAVVLEVNWSLKLLTKVIDDMLVAKFNETISVYSSWKSGCYILEYWSVTHVLKLAAALASMTSQCPDHWGTLCASCFCPLYRLSSSTP